MKKIILSVIILLLFSVPTISKASTSITVLKVNNIQLKTSQGTPFVSSGTTYVPINAIAEQMGARKTTWSTKTNKAVITLKDKTVINVTKGKSTATVKGKSVPLKTKVVNKVAVPVNAKAIVKKNILYVPIDFISTSNGLNYPVKTVKSSGKITIYIGTLPATGVKKYGHMLSKQTVYTSQSTSSKSLGTISKNKNVYVYASQSGWYQVKIGEKKGWVKTSTMKMGKYVAPTTGKKYPDGWVAPVLKSKWSSNEDKNFLAFEKELKFEDGVYFSIVGQPYIVTIQRNHSKGEVMLQFKGWENDELKQSYRVPVVSKELFKFYFEKDADRVLKYFNRDDIPEKFVANGRTVKASYNDADASLHLIVGYKNKPF